MDSTKESLSNLSISSIVPDNNPSNEGTEALSSLTVKLLMDAISNTIVENTTLSNEILQLTSKLKCDVKSLSPDIKETLQTVAAILKSEGLSDIDQNALWICLEERYFHNMIKERQERVLKAKYNAAFARYSAIQEKVIHLRKESELLDNLLESTDKEMTETRIILSTKINDYKATVKKLERELNSLMTEEIAFDKILERSSKLSDDLNTLDQLNRALEKYGDLPPNLLQAKNMLNSKKKELEEIENSISEKMNE